MVINFTLPQDPQGTRVCVDCCQAKDDVWARRDQYYADIFNEEREVDRCEACDTSNTLCI